MDAVLLAWNKSNAFYKNFISLCAINPTLFHLRTSGVVKQSRSFPDAGGRGRTCFYNKPSDTWSWRFIISGDLLHRSNQEFSKQTGLYSCPFILHQITITMSEQLKLSSKADETENTSIVQKRTPKRRHRNQNLEPDNSSPTEEYTIDNGAKSTTDEFAHIQLCASHMDQVLRELIQESIPETPVRKPKARQLPALSRTRVEERQASEWQLPLRVGQGGKRKRTESIRSNDGLEKQTERNFSGTYT